MSDTSGRRRRDRPAREELRSGPRAPRSPASGDGAATAGATGVREALDSVRRLVRALRLGANRAHESAGISSAELFILRALEENGPANSLNELAARTYTDQSSASPVVTRLQRRHLIRRQRSEHDRRRISIELTDRGRQVLSRAPDAPQSGIIAALRRLPPADRTQIARALTKLVEQMGLDDERATMLFEEPSKR